MLEYLARRQIRRSGYYVHSRWERVLTEIDQRALPSLKCQVRWETNQDGERGSPVPADREGLYRVLVVGGSAAECFLLDQDSAWPSVMQQLLNAPDARRQLGATQVHVGNIGRPMIPVSGIRTMLELTLPRYERLDLAVLMVGASDATEWLELGTPASIAPGVKHDRLFGESPEVKLGWRPRQTALWRLARAWRRRFSTQPRIRRNGGSRFIEMRRRRLNAKHWISKLPDPKPMLDRLEEELTAVVRLLQARGTRVLIVRQPWLNRRLSHDEEALMWSFSRGRLEFEAPSDTYYTHDAVQELLGQVDQRVTRVTRTLGVQTLDLLPLLEPSLRNYYDLLHFTPEGARQVALHTATAVLNPATLRTVARPENALRLEPAENQTAVGAAKSERV